MLPFGEELQATWGRPSEARRLASSPRSKVWRVRLDDTTAVVKQVVDGVDPAGRFAREVTALRLAGRASPAVAPRVLGTSERDLVMVLEHVEEQPAPPGWTTTYARGLARLHATTGAADAGALPPWQPPTAKDVDAFLALAEALGVPSRPDVRGELTSAVDRLAPGGQFALLHGDPCPGNDLHTADGMRFVDFEQASLGNGLVELAYLHVGFPTCWCASALPAAEIAAAEAAYRSTWRSLAGREVSGTLADACLGWLVRGDALVEKARRDTDDHLARVPVEDWNWGPSTARERLAYRLGVVTSATAGRSELSGTHALTAALRERMLVSWPDLVPLPSKRPAESMLSGELDDD